MDTTEENMFVWEGSQVQLRCVVMNTLADNVGKVFWLRNGKILNKYDLTTSTTLSFQVGNVRWYAWNHKYRVGHAWLNNLQYVSLSLIQTKLDGTKLTETLTFVGVQKELSGNYSCSLENVGTSSVTLHVLSGKSEVAGWISILTIFRDS